MDLNVGGKMKVKIDRLNFHNYKGDSGPPVLCRGFVRCLKISFCIIVSVPLDFDFSVMICLFPSSPR